MNNQKNEAENLPAYEQFSKGTVGDFSDGPVSYLDFLSYKTAQRRPLSQKLPKDVKNFGLVDRLHLLSNELAFEGMQNSDQIRAKNMLNIQEQNLKKAKRFVQKGLNPVTCTTQKTEPKRKDFLQRLERDYTQQKVDRLWTAHEKTIFGKNVRILRQFQEINQNPNFQNAPPKKENHKNTFADAVESIVRTRILQEVEENAYKDSMLKKTKKLLSRYLEDKLHKKIEDKIAKIQRSYSSFDDFVKQQLEESSAANFVDFHNHRASSKRKKDRTMQKIIQKLANQDEAMKWYEKKESVRDQSVQFEKQVMRDKSFNVLKTISQIKLIEEIRQQLYPRYAIEKSLRNGTLMLKDCDTKNTEIKKMKPSANEDTYEVQLELQELSEGATLNAKDPENSLIFKCQELESGQKPGLNIDLRNPDSNLQVYQSLRPNTEIADLEQQLYRLASEKRPKSKEHSKGQGRRIAEMFGERFNKNYRDLELKTCVNAPIKSKVIQQLKKKGQASSRKMPIQNDQKNFTFPRKLSSSLQSRSEQDLTHQRTLKSVKNLQGFERNTPYFMVHNSSVPLQKNSNFHATLQKSLSRTQESARINSTKKPTRIMTEMTEEDVHDNLKIVDFDDEVVKSGHQTKKIRPFVIKLKAKETQESKLNQLSTRETEQHEVLTCLESQASNSQLMDNEKPLGKPTFGDQYQVGTAKNATGHAELNSQPNKLRAITKQHSTVLDCIKKPSIRTLPLKRKIAKLESQSSAKFKKLENATNTFEINRTDNIYDHKKLLDLIDKGVFHEKYVHFILSQIPEKKQFILNDLVQRMTEKNNKEEFDS